MQVNNNSSKEILVTGGGGFIGSYLVQALTVAGHKVVVFDINPERIRLEGFSNYETKIKPNLSFVEGDLTCLPTVLEVFDRYRPTTVFHLGALLSAGAEARPQLGYQTDLGGTQNVLEAARLFGGDGKERIKVLFPSTIASFGTHLPGEKDGVKPLVPNEFIQMPTTVYGVAKVSAERLGEYYNRKGWLDFRAVRFPSVIGAGRGPGGTTVYSTLMAELPAHGENYSAYVYENTRVAILYVRDAVSALLGLWKANEENFGKSLLTPDQIKSESDAAKAERILANRVYNIQGIVDKTSSAPQPPKAIDIYAALKDAPDNLEFKIKNPDFKKGSVSFAKPPADGTTPTIITTLNGFGFLADTRAQKEWGWSPQYDLQQALDDFVNEVQTQPKRIKKLELWG
ncbi:MAG: NAD-dependent epimerase/dehydratase family protein [Pseudomonadota bacterium]